ncbi:MAG: type II toxin-antitoxin system PemK/MazF family toxin [Gammaproteobacteria bacterium]|nr:type II toxin-antitoxin system PemK/MazF family toxin [Gammaproteobacteria bacterium]
MTRGDIVTVAAPGDYGKPRSAVIIQDDIFKALPSVTVLPLTSELRDAPIIRITVEPRDSNGLRKPSQIMIDKTVTVPRSRLGEQIGRLDINVMQSIDIALARFLRLQK